MQLTDLLAVAVAGAATVAAVPHRVPAVRRQGTVNPFPFNGQSFNLITLRSGSEVHFAPVQAAMGGLMLKAPEQDAYCSGGSDNGNYATFYYGGHLDMYLWGGALLNISFPQQLYVDRSGMGQGKFGFASDPATLPKNAETTNFTVSDTQDLSFAGAGFLACPNAAPAESNTTGVSLSLSTTNGTDDGSAADPSWSLWLDTGVTAPAGLQGCLGVTLRLVQNNNATGCLYTEAGSKSE